MLTRYKVLLLTDTGVAAPPFVPTDIAGLLLWLDGSDITTLFQDVAKTIPVTADGDVVGAWADKSGNGNDVKQSTTANRPLYKAGIKNGLSTIRFDGSNDHLKNINIAGINSVSAVWVRTAGGLAQSAFSGKPEWDYAITRNDTKQNAWYLDAAWRSGAASTNTNWRVNVWTMSPTDAYVYLNSVVDVSYLGGVLTAGNITTIGALDNGIGNLLLGDIGEIVMYNSVLSDLDRAALQTYINSKWAVY